LVSGHLDNNDSRRKLRRLPLLQLQRVRRLPGNRILGFTPDKVIRTPLPVRDDRQ
jgi:hypothetical protein